MRSLGIILSLAFLFAACDNKRLYEKNTDLNNEQWLAKEKPSFDFTIDDVAAKYNLYCNIRNEVSYPKANLYFTYSITDSTGKSLQNKLVSQYLFDKKTGEPFGDSGLGDIYDHQFPIAMNYEFKSPGKYSVKFEQFMRMDTLPGILAVGLRVEKVPASKK
jgi:gliding motility-associated lipoprotein GldH